MKPQLLAPAALVVGGSAYNTYAAPLLGTAEAQLLYFFIGFTSYKLAVYAWVYRNDIEPIVVAKAKAFKGYRP